MAGSRIAIATQPQLASSSERVSVGGFGAVNDYDPFAAPKVVATVTVPYAYDVAFGGDGNAYVSSESDNAVHVYTPRGTFARAISVPSPRGIGFDPQGNLYVADATSIAVYPPNADKPARRITGVIDPQIALDSAGNLLVTSLEKDGTYAFLSYASGSDHPDRKVALGPNGFVSAIATDSSNNVYLAQSNLGKVVIFAPSETTPVRSLTGIRDPKALLVDGSTLYVASAGSSRLELYRSGTAGASTPFRLITNGINMPTALALAHDRSIYVANYGNHTLVRYFPRDPVPATSLQIKYPTRLAINDKGDIVVASIVTDVVQFLAPPSATMPLRTLTDGVNGAVALAFDAAGNEYVLNRNAASVTVYARDGGAPIRTIAMSGIPYLSALAVDGSGRLYVADRFQQSVLEYLPGATTPSRTITDGIRSPEALAIDREGNLYVADSNVQVTVYDPATGHRLRTLAGALRFPISLQFDAYGNLYVGCARSVEIFAPEATSPSRTIVQGINVAKAMAFDSLGNLFVANLGSNTVTEYEPYATAPVATISHGISGPWALAVTSADHLFVANIDSDSVAVFGLPDTKPLLTITKGIAGPRALAVVP